MTVKGGSRPACAACRFQRRRCSSDCPLAPFFPASDSKTFQSVHRLYGVGNVMKILNHLDDDEQKEEAMKSIKYESQIREIRPVEGCYGTIAILKQNLAEQLRELRYFRFMLDALKKRYESTHKAFIKSSLMDTHLVNNEIKTDESLGGSSDCTNLMMNKENDRGFYYFGSSDRKEMKLYDWDDQVTPFMDRKELQQPYDWDDQVKPFMDPRIRSQFDEFQSDGSPDYTELESCGVEQDNGSPDYTEITSDSLVDDQQYWFMGSKEAFELSLESSFKDPRCGDPKAIEGLFQVGC